jgi:hypothetical protein
MCGVLPYFEKIRNSNIEIRNKSKIQIANVQNLLCLLQYCSKNIRQFYCFLLQFLSFIFQMFAIVLSNFFTNILTSFAKASEQSSKSYCFEFRILVIRICFGFRASGFEFYNFSPAPLCRVLLSFLQALFNCLPAYHLNVKGLYPPPSFKNFASARACIWIIDRT